MYGCRGTMQVSEEVVGGVGSSGSTSHRVGTVSQTHLTLPTISPASISAAYTSLQTNSTPTPPSPKNLDILDELSNSDLDSASHQGPGHDSGSRGDHIPPEDLSGRAGALPKDAGPSV